MPRPQPGIPCDSASSRQLMATVYPRGAWRSTHLSPRATAGYLDRMAPPAWLLGLELTRFAPVDDAADALAGSLSAVEAGGWTLSAYEGPALQPYLGLSLGRFEVASEGTVFLDEVGEIPLELQPKLLRVLQEREFERLGSGKTLRTDARLIAATNRDLGAMVEAGRFRADLFYRLNVFPVHVPPLRERREDIPLLVRHFVQAIGRRMGKVVETIPAETMAALTSYEWPGNVRELQNLVERAMILTSGPVLRVPLDGVKPRGTRVRDAAGLPPVPPQTLREAERAHVLSALEETGWVLGGARGAAARLGLNRSTLQFRMKKLGIARPGR
ncbi:MAG: AAA family ATPase [Acidobacteria bacterium ACB2]|nr:AAA family ATPase [Acidobacteria bacterium ACB2]